MLECRKLVPRQCAPIGRLDTIRHIERTRVRKAVTFTVTQQSTTRLPADIYVYLPGKDL